MQIILSLQYLQNNEYFTDFQAFWDKQTVYSFFTFNKCNIIPWYNWISLYHNMIHIS